MAKAANLSEADHDRVSAAVHTAEAGTAGEIVTIVAEESDRYRDVALWWSATAGVLALVFISVFPEWPLSWLSWLGGGWEAELTLAESFELALALFVLKFVGARLILLWRPLLLFLTPKFIKRDRTHRRAVRYFKVGAERRTTGRTGILIYLSLDEHMAEIVADSAIHSVVPAEAWGAAMAKLIAEARQGRIADGMIAAIGEVGTILAEHFPRADDDQNELPDRLIEL